MTHKGPLSLWRDSSERREPPDTQVFITFACALLVLMEGPDAGRGPSCWGWLTTGRRM